MFTKTKQSKQKHRYCHKMLAALLTVVLIFVMLPSASAAELSGYGDTSVVNIINNGSGKYLNVGLGYDTNGNNIYQYTNDSSVEQKFRLKYYSANKCYFINAMCSSDGYDKGLSAVSTSSTSNVQLYSVSTSSTLQQWVFSYVGNGLYTISPYANSSLYLTAHNGSNGSRSKTATSGSNASGNVYVTTMNGTDETGELTYGQYQLWRIDSLIHARRAEQGYYRIKNVKSGMYISRDASGNISQQPESTDYMQTWFLYDMGGNHIVYAADNLWFGLAMYSGTNGASFSYDDSIGNYLNVIRNYGESTYRIATDYSYYGYVATVRLGSTEAGATIVQTTYVDSDSQKWELEPVDIDSGVVYIESNTTENIVSVKYDEVNDDYIEPDGVIDTEPLDGYLHQRWTVISNGDTSVRLVSQESGMCLSVLEDTLSSTATIVQQEYSDKVGQKWDLYEVFGYWVVRSYNSKYVLTLSGNDLSLISVSFYGTIDTGAQWTVYDTTGVDKVKVISPPDYTVSGSNTMSGYTTENLNSALDSFVYETGFKKYTDNSTRAQHGMLEMTGAQITAVMAHGTATSVNFSATEALTVTDMASLPSDVFSSSDLIIYLSCSSGATVSGGNNIVQQTYAKGAGCVIGWKNDIAAREADIWSAAFFADLSAGESIQQAITKACTDIALDENISTDTMLINSVLVLGDSSVVY